MNPTNNHIHKSRTDKVADGVAVCVAATPFLLGCLGLVVCLTGVALLPLAICYRLFFR